jgi:hypothetical protein
MAYERGGWNGFERSIHRSVPLVCVGYGDVIRGDAPMTSRGGGVRGESDNPTLKVCVQPVSFKIDYMGRRVSLLHFQIEQLGKTYCSASKYYFKLTEPVSINPQTLQYHVFNKMPTVVSTDDMMAE